MTSFSDNEQLQAYLPLYDVMPEPWEEARPQLVETLKRMTSAINARQLGWYLDEELISGIQFIPLAPTANSANSQNYRTVFRKVIDFSPLIAGVNPPVPHGIVFDVNFTLIDLWVSATNSTTFNAITMSDPTNVTIDATNINITSPGAYDRAFAFAEYTLEI